MDKDKLAISAATAEIEHRIGGCDTTTSMAQSIAETYATRPDYYGATFCVNCRAHFPVGERGEFIWEDGSRVGS